VSLRLELRAPETALVRADPAPVTVTLTNDGPEPTVVNRRMAPGYADSVSREVYFDTDGAYGLRKYERDLPSRTDFGVLEPGAGVSAEIDLLAWYRMREPGTYRFVAHYQCDEPLVDLPEGALRGVVDSAPVIITVR
jgi:hypothetical protein